MTDGSFVIGPAIAIGALGVLALNVYAIVLVVVRSRAYGTRLYRPMLLNIALSNVPIVLAFAMIVGTLGIVASGVTTFRVPLAFLLVSGVAFVAFFPNALYLITELNFSHRREGDGVPMWFDIVMTLTLTLSGIVNAITSLAIVQTFAILVGDVNRFSPWPPGWSWAATAAVLLLACLGIYLGRQLRFNSWDVLRPWRIVAKLWRHLRPPGRVREMVAFVLAHALLLGVLYAMVYLPIYLLVMGYAFGAR